MYIQAVFRFYSFFLLFNCNRSNSHFFSYNSFKLGTKYSPVRVSTCDFFCVLSLLKTIQRNSLLLLFTYHSRKLVRKMQVVEKFIHWLQVSRKALYVLNQQLPFSFPSSSSVKLTSSIFFLFLAVNAWCVRWNSVSRFRPVIKDCFYLNVVS